MAEKNVIRKRVLSGIPYKPAFLKEIRNYYRDKYNLVSKKTAMQDNFLFNITKQGIKIVTDAYQLMIT